MTSSLPNRIRSRVVGAWACAILCWGVLAIAPGTLFAQYIRAGLDPSLNDQTAKLLKNEHLRILLAQVDFDQANKDRLALYYKGVFFRQMTWEENESTLPDMRFELLRDLRMAATPEIHQEVVEATYQTMLTIAGNASFSPAVRINAMLILGALNETEKTISMPPVPLTKARELLRRVLMSPQPDGIRLAALTGLTRHLESRWYPNAVPIPDPEVDRLVADLLQIANERTPPATRSRAAHDYIRARAVDALAAMNVLGNGASVYKALDQIVGDDEASLSLRCSAALALGRFDYTQVVQAKRDLSDTVRRLAALGAEVCEHETSRLEFLKQVLEQRKDIGAPVASTAGDGYAGGGGAGPTMGPMGGPMGGSGPPGGEMFDPNAAMGAMGDMGPMGGPMGMGGGFPAFGKPDVVPEFQKSAGRRRVRAQMLAIERSLKGVDRSDTRKGLQSTVAPDKQEVVASILATLGDVLTLTDTEQSYDDLIAGYAQARTKFLASAPAPAVDPLATPPAAPGAEGALPDAAGAAIPGAGDAIPGAGAGAAIPDAGAAIPDAGAAIPAAPAAPMPADGAAPMPAGEIP